MYILLRVCGSGWEYCLRDLVFLSTACPATAGGLLELRACSSTYIPTSDNLLGTVANVPRKEYRAIWVVLAVMVP